jgi:hypothetical protein
MIALTAWMSVHLFTVFMELSNDSTRAFSWAVLLILSPVSLIGWTLPTWWLARAVQPEVQPRTASGQIP